MINTMLFVGGVAILTVIAFMVIASLDKAKDLKPLTPAQEAAFETGEHPLADMLMASEIPAKDIPVVTPKRGEFKTRKEGDVTIHIHKRRRFK